ncbi:MAG: serine protease, partial [Coriobacteriia bacterium]|nr:serine protease [Coriobacteriia bacterium]
MRRKPIILLLLAAMLANSAGCTLGGRVNIQSTDLMDGYTAAADISPKPADAAFTASQADFALSLFKQAYDSGQNTLVSPLSVMLALAMTANGADSETLSQMEQMLSGDLTISQLNEYLYGYVGSLPNSEKSKLEIANSIWFRDDEQLLEVRPRFLQRNADYYGASAYATPFDEQAVFDINRWVSRNTGGLIKQVVDEIDPNTMLYLINTVI